MTYTYEQLSKISQNQDLHVFQQNTQKSMCVSLNTNKKHCQYSGLQIVFFMRRHLFVGKYFLGAKSVGQEPNLTI